MIGRQDRFNRALSEHYGAALVEIERLRAQIVAMRDEAEPFPVQRPHRGQAVLACACGVVLDTADMVRIRTPHDEFHHDAGTAIYRIGCIDCAVEAWPA